MNRELIHQILMICGQYMPGNICVLILSWWSRKVEVREEMVVGVRWALCLFTKIFRCILLNSGPDTFIRMLIMTKYPSWNLIYLKLILNFNVYYCQRSTFVNTIITILNFEISGVSSSRYKQLSMILLTWCTWSAKCCKHAPFHLPLLWLGLRDLPAHVYTLDRLI